MMYQHFDTNPYDADEQPQLPGPSTTHRMVRSRDGQFWTFATVEETAQIEAEDAAARERDRVARRLLESVEVVE